MFSLNYIFKKINILVHFFEWKCKNLGPFCIIIQHPLAYNLETSPLIKIISSTMDQISYLNRALMGPEPQFSHAVTRSVTVLLLLHAGSPCWLTVSITLRRQYGRQRHQHHQQNANNEADFRLLNASGAASRHQAATVRSSKL